VVVGEFGNETIVCESGEFVLKFVLYTDFEMSDCHLHSWKNSMESSLKYY